MNVYLFQPQYPVAVRDQINYWLPYSAGCIWSYALTNDRIRKNYQLAGLGYDRLPVDQVVASMQDPRVVGLSCYVWNEQYCLALARAVKLRWPKCWIVLGGANAHGSQLKYDFLDTIVQAEGEQAFTDVLLALLDGRDPEPVYSAARLQDLDIPSPYLTGVFDTIIKARPDALWAMTFETNRGCPYACTFCDWGGTTYSKVKRFGLERVVAELEWAVLHPVAYAVCADANFGIFKDRDIALAQEIRSACDRSSIDAVDINFAKNNPDTNYEIARILGPYGRGITVSVQSMDGDVLEAIKRKNLKVNDIGSLITLSERTGVMTYTEMILGLPLETRETWRDGMTELLEVGQHQTIDMWLATLLRNSEMAQPDQRRAYGIESIWARDYMSLGPASLDDGIPELAEIVRATSTMTQQDLVDSYMYGWMIIHWHCMGYIQVVARWARTCAGIAYRQFYDCLYNRIVEHELFGPHHAQLRSLVDGYLTRGYMTDSEKAWVRQGGHAFHAVSYSWMWQHRAVAADLALDVLAQWVTPPKDLISIQSLSTWAPDQQLPQEIDCNWDYRTGTQRLHRYTITTRLTNTDDLDFYALRRKGLIKNQIQIEPIDPQ